MTERALAESLELDPDKRVEGGEGADARRRVELPPEIPRSVHPDEIGPRSRPLLLALVCLAVVSMFVLFAAYLVMEAIGLPLGLVALVVPGTLLAAVAVLAVRVLRDPDDHPDHASGDIVERPSPPGPGEAPERTVGT